MDTAKAAHRGTFEEFVTAFDVASTAANAGQLLLEAAANKDLHARYAILTFLLDGGALASERTEDGENALHVMLGQVRNDPNSSAAVAKRLIQAGADVNALDKRKMLPLQYVLNMKLTDDELGPLYDVFFAQPALDTTTPNAFGLSPLASAAKLPFRADVRMRMEEYGREHTA